MTETETDAQQAERKALADELVALSAKVGTAMTAKTLNPYIRNGKNWGESLAGFQVAAVFAGDASLAENLLKIFSDKPTHDKIADVWIQKLIKRVGTDKLASSTPSDLAGEKELAAWVFSKHNGGEGQKSKIPDYVTKTMPVWDRTFCVQEGAATSGYIKLTALKT